MTNNFGVSRSNRAPEKMIVMPGLVAWICLAFIYQTDSITLVLDFPEQKIEQFTRVDQK